MLYADFIAGWTAGATGLVIGHPLDTIKARLQTMNTYKGIVDCFLATVKNESVRGLYKGMWIPFLSTGALHSLIFVGYGTALRLLHPGESNVEARKDLPMSEIMIASMCGTFAQLGPVIPIELIKTKLQVQRESVSSSVRSSTLYSGPFDCARQTVKAEGFRGLFKGGYVMVCRDNIGYLFYIPVYESLLRQARKYKLNETASQILAGGCAGTTSWLSICPLEVVKNTVQADKSLKKKSNREVIIKLYREGGIRTFYRGGLALSLRGFVVNSVLFVVYEKTMAILS